MRREERIIIIVLFIMAMLLLFTGCADCVYDTPTTVIRVEYQGDRSCLFRYAYTLRYGSGDTAIFYSDNKYSVGDTLQMELHKMYTNGEIR